MSQNDLMNILLAPCFSEKADRIADAHRQYVFKVSKRSSKPQIAKAVEQLFDVKVDSVNVLHVKPKTRRFGRIEGKRSGWKKAFIKLKDGYEINLAGTER